MNEKNKTTRLSDVTKRNTTDRASKLAGAFIPAPPVLVAATPPQAEKPTPPETSTDRIDQVVIDDKQESAATLLESETKNQPDSAQDNKVTPAEKPKERSRRSVATMDLAEVVSQPTPKGLRCTKMIMLVEEHHDLLRELAYKFKMPMTEVLYNLLEPANQALQRELKKGD